MVKVSNIARYISTPMLHLQSSNARRRLYVRMVAYFYSWYVRVTIAKALLYPFTCPALTLQNLQFWKPNLFSSTPTILVQECVPF